MFSYSTDEEYYTGKFETAALAAQQGFADNPEHDEIYIGENTIYNAHDFINTRDILDQIAENATDECGESAEDWLEALTKNKDKRAELTRLIGDWLERNDPVMFWSVSNAQIVKKGSIR